ncbi:hypothetical protein ACLB2K_043177 [Fragaria x ananassa]
MYLEMAIRSVATMQATSKNHQKGLVEADDGGNHVGSVEGVFEEADDGIRAHWFDLINDPIYIFNPFTRESVIVPYPTIGIADFYFGFRPKTNEYKVVGLVATHCIAGFLGFKIFTLGQGSWRNIMVDWHHPSFVHPPPSHFWNSVCVHGARHWLAPSDEAIFALDMEDERLRIIPVPSECKFNQRYKKIIEVDKCLLIVCENGMVWILKDYKHQVWVAETIKVPLPQCTTHTGEFVFDVLQNNFLQLYDRKSKNSRQSKIIFPKRLPDLGLRLDHFAVSFDDCLVPLK